jgi:Toprim-like/Protein of unknown function (DUF3991)
VRHLAHQDVRRAVNWRARADRLRALPLPVVLEELGATPDPHDPAKWRTQQGILSVSGPKFMNWNQGGGGGGAIDLVMHVRQLGFGQALEWLERRFAGLTPPQPGSMLEAPALTLPAPVQENWPRVERYLVEERKLPRALLSPLVQSGIIYADVRANAVFLLVGPNVIPVGAELRGTTALAWRGMAAGSRKDRGFFFLPSTPCQAIVLCESAIDTISCHALHPAYRCISTSGARPHPEWLSSLLQPGQPIYCGFDADATGDLMAQRMCDLHPSIQRLRPAAKDWNDLLCQQGR